VTSSGVQAHAYVHSAGIWTPVGWGAGDSSLPVFIAQPARTTIVLYGTALATGATGVEALLTLSQQKGGVVTSASSFTVTSGKKLRIQAIHIGQVGNSNAAVGTTLIRMRQSTTGAVTTTTPLILAQTRIVNPATASAFSTADITLEDGMELVGDGVAQFGFTVNSTFTFGNAPTVDLMIFGYEY
jgi:hypothetical protein